MNQEEVFSIARIHHFLILYAEFKQAAKDLHDEDISNLKKIYEMMRVEEGE